MTKTPRVGGLEIDHDLPFQQRDWTAQRVGWVVMGLLLLAAVLGLFGSGPLAHASVSGGDGTPFRLEYERFTRKHAPSRLSLHLGPNIATDGVARVWLDRRYADGVLVEEVDPEPESVTVESDRVTYTFRVGDPARATLVVFSVEPEEAGVLGGRVGVAASAPVAFRQVVYP